MKGRPLLVVQLMAVLLWFQLSAVSALAFTNLVDAYAAIGFDPFFPGNTVVVQFSDQHMCLKTEGLPAPAPTTNLHPQLVSTLNAMVPPPAKIIVSGDVSSNLSPVPGYDGLKDAVAYQWATNEMTLFRLSLAQLTNVVRSNIVWIPGNHDQSPMETNAETFCRMFPGMPPYQTFDLAGLRFFLVNSGNYGESSASQREWLRQQVAATSPTQQVVVVTHQPPFNGIVVHRGIALMLRELFGDWQARWWVLGGHEHSRSVNLFNVGRSNVMQIVTGPASTNTFVGFTHEVGYRILCLSNGIAGQIYYHIDSANFEPQQQPEWESPQSFVAAFEGVPGLLWRRLKSPSPAPEVLVSNAFNSMTWWAYTAELQLALPLARYGNQATHFVLLAGGFGLNSGLEFSADRTNWVRMPRPVPTNYVYSFPIPPEIACLATGYVRYLGDGMNDWVGGWGLASTNWWARRLFPQFVHTANQAIALGQVMTVTNVPVDPYAPPDQLRFTLLSAPAGVVLDRSSGVLSWQPTNAATLGNSLITLKVADTGTPEFSATQTFRVTVVASNSPPLLPSNSPPVLSAIPNQRLGLGMTLRLPLEASDPDFDLLTFRLGAGAPTNAYFNPISGLLEWTPSEAQLGSYVWSVIVTDSGVPPLSATQHLALTVVPRNHAPTLAAIPDQTLEAGTTLALANTAFDVDGDQLTFLLGAGAPTNAAIDPVTGDFSWTPTFSQVGSHLIEVRVNDSGAPTLSAAQQFTVTVERGLQPPVARLGWGNGRPQLSVFGDGGLAYSIETSTNLMTWKLLYTTNVMTTPFQVDDTRGDGLPQRFYRVQVAHRSWDPDAEAFFQRAGLTDYALYANEREALQQLVLDYKAAGLWEVKDAIYPFVGTSSNACAQNLKGPSYAVTFTTNGIAYTNGITSDGTGWGDTGLNLGGATNYQKNSGSLFAYIGTASPTYFKDGLGCFLGAVDFNGYTARASLERNGSAFTVSGLNGTDLWNWLGAMGDFRGPVFVSRVSPMLQYNGTDWLMVTNNTMSSTRVPNVTCSFFARKSDDGQVDHKVACNLRGASIGAGMTPADFAREAALWHRFNAALGREVR